MGELGQRLQKINVPDDQKNLLYETLAANPDKILNVTKEIKTETDIHRIITEIKSSSTSQLSALSRNYDYYEMGKIGSRLAESAL